MNLISINKIIGAATANGGLCCGCCCRKQSYCGDIAIKLSIAALVCIALCYACLVVETQRSKAVAEQQQLLKEKYTQIKDADELSQQNEQQIDGSGEDGILFEMHLVKQENDANTHKPPSLLLFHTETNQPSFESDENEQNAIKRFLPVASTNASVHREFSAPNDWLPSDEVMEVKGEETETPSMHLSDISNSLPKNDWMHHIPLQSDDENEDGFLFDSAPPTIEWITASVESGERFFPQELTLDTIPEEDESLTDGAGIGAVGAGQQSAEHFILTDSDNGDFMHVKAQSVTPLLPTLPPPFNAFITPPTKGWEGVLETLFGNMANIIKPAQQQQQQQQCRHQQNQHQATAKDSNWVKRYNC